eukprot:TRINITY_DN2086_c0_g2_i2.p1 TRINITY_DN2086_c0_g2~~TRINITY_DN2086_c0_g2_i2.p1  ORF type:complete len:358 (+),score=104.51 TRINITY_DN2086_c0_g2_i2:478-1551(+)
MVGLPFEKVAIRAEDWFREKGISILRKEVHHVNLPSTDVSFTDGSSLHADSVLIASGGRARTLPLPGHQLANIFTLRTFEDSQNIRKAVENAKSAVILGSSFIGMELATCLKKNHSNLSSVTVVGMEKVPFERVMGLKFGQLTQKVFEANGIQFKLQRTASQFKGQNKVESVVLDNGEELKADIVVIGAGIVLTSEYLERSGLELNKDGSLTVDEYLLATKKRQVYAAGDIARFPYHSHHIRVEHWSVAQQQGRVAAKNMLGKRIKYDEVPFFWSNSLVAFRYAGHASTYDDIIFQGDETQMKFIAFYVEGEKVNAVATVGVNGAVAAIELMRENRMPLASEVRRGVDLDKLLHRKE